MNRRATIIDDDGDGGGRRKNPRCLDEGIKLALLESETWGDFQECELALREEGMEKASARRVALARYCPDELLPAGIGRDEADPAKVKRRKPKTPVEQKGIWTRGEGDYGGAEPKPKNKPKTKRDSAPPANLVDAELGEKELGDEPDPGRAWPDMSGLGDCAGLVGEGDGGGVKKRTNDDLPELPSVSRHMFHKKEANEIEVIRWVARNMDIRDVKPKDCPDAAAWRLLKRCRDSKLFEQLFWQSMWTKVVPSRTQLDKESGPSEMDGTQEIAMIGKIRASAERAKAAAAEAEKEAESKLASRVSGLAEVGGNANAGLGE